MSVTFLSGWEGGNSFEFASVTGTVVTSTAQKKTGSYAMEVTAASTPRYMTSGFIGRAVAFWLYIDTALNAEDYIVGTSGSNNIRLTSDRYLKVYDQTTLLGTSTTQLSTGTWYHVAMSVSTTGYAVRLWLNGTIDANINGVNSTVNYITGVHIGLINGSAASGKLYFDDFIQDGLGRDTSLGQCQIVVARPSGAGNYNDWDTHTSVAEPNNYQNIDDAPGSIDDSDYEEQAGSTQTRDTFALPNVATLGISGVFAVRTLARMKTSASSSAAGITVRDNGSDYDSLVSTTTTTTWYSLTDPDLPNGSGAWTDARFDAFEVGCISTGSTRDTFLYALMVMVAYIPSGTPATVTAVTATAEATANAPVISIGTSALATAPTATVTAQANTPVITAVRNLTIAVPTATVTCQANTPVVTAQTSIAATINAPIATVNSQGNAPVVSTGTGVGVISPGATATATCGDTDATFDQTVFDSTIFSTGENYFPVVSASAVLVAPTAATVNTSATVPVVTAETGSIPATVTAPTTTVTATANVPTVSAGTGNTVSPPTATATSASTAPAISMKVSVTGVVASVTATSNAPVVSAGVGTIVTTPTATVQAASTAPAPNTLVNIVGVTATANSSSSIPVVNVGSGITSSAPTGTVAAQVNAPALSTSAVVSPPTTAATTQATFPIVSVAGTVNIAAPTAAVSSEANAPSVSSKVSVIAPTGQVVAQAASGLGVFDPTIFDQTVFSGASFVDVTTTANVTVPSASVTGQGSIPEVNVVVNAEISAPTATAMVTATIPAVFAAVCALVAAPTALVTALVFAPVVRSILYRNIVATGNERDVVPFEDRDIVASGNTRQISGSQWRNIVHSGGTQ
ncbi:MAG: hypothetical protein TUN42_04250 [Dehalogenimonas sp.]